jgi:hypothetical protein
MLIKNVVKATESVTAATAVANGNKLCNLADTTAVAPRKTMRSKDNGELACTNPAARASFNLNM